MTLLTLLSSAGFAVSAFTGAVLMAASRRTRNGRYFLSFVCLQGALLFLKDVVERSGGPVQLTTFLIYSNFLFGIPALYLFLRSTFDEPARHPLPHFIPALANLPAALMAASESIGSAGIDSAIPAASDPQTLLPVVYINILAAGETLQLGLYAHASLQFLRRDAGSAKRRAYKRIVLAVVACYSVYYAVRWTGLGIRFFATADGGLAALAPWVNPASMIFLAGFIALAGLYIMTRPDVLFGRATVETRPKYGGKRLSHADAEAIVRRATQLLSSCEDLSGRTIDPRRLAALLDLPYYLLSRAVNEHCRQTVSDLIREQRIMRARALLDSEPDSTILSIALDAGFSAKSSFNEAFKKTTGMSPREYRRQQK